MVQQTGTREQTKPDVGRSLPQSLNAEASVLGSMIVDPRCIPAVMSRLKVVDFFHAEHQLIYGAVLGLYETNNMGVDGLLVCNRLRKEGDLAQIGRGDEQEGVEYLQRIVNTVPSAANVEYYLRIVKEASLRRGYIAAGMEVTETAYDESKDLEEVHDLAEAKLFALTEQGRKPNEVVAIPKLMVDLYAAIEKRSGGLTLGIPSGFIELDAMTSGFRGGEMIILAGRPSSGKTALALNIADYVALNEQKPVVIFSMEMGRESLAERIACASAQLDSNKVRRGTVSIDDYNKLLLVLQKYQDAPIYIDDTSPMTPFDLRSRVRELRRKYGIELVFLDYLQLMSVGHKIESRQQEVSEISRHLKSIAREMNIPIIALSQLNRECESREDHRPRMSDLRESGSLENDADMVLLLHREDYYNKTDPQYIKTNIAEVIIGKNRNGPTGTVQLVFFEEQTRFESKSAVGDTPF